MTSALLVAKIHIPGHFTPKQSYRALYDFDGKGWFTVDDSKTIHWLCPNDDKPHQNIYNETWIVENFHIVEVK